MILANWRSLELSRQFLIVSAVTIVCAMGVVGAWLSSRIETMVTQSTAFDTALYVENSVGERIQALADDANHDPSVQRELEQLVLRTPLGRRIVSFKVWASGGRIIYASRPEHVVTSFAPTENLKKAWTGTIAYEFDALHDAEDAVERAMNLPMLEIYVPVRRRFGGDIIAVVEFYEDASKLVDEIDRAKRAAWLLLGAIGSIVVAALYGMARRASRTIELQRAALNGRIADLSRLLDQNLALRQRVETTSRRATELNERFLRRLGSDLHDGPAQLISLALFRLDAAQSGPPTAGAGVATLDARVLDDKSKVRTALDEALKEIRNLSLGLSMPELGKASVSEAINEAVQSHMYRTGCRIDVATGRLPAFIPERDVKMAVYRFVQEGLNNAYRHAPGAPVKVRADVDSDGRITIEISDEGPGFDADLLGRTDRLGLAGLRERIEFVGGELAVDSKLGQGTRLRFRLPTDLGAGQ